MAMTLDKTWQVGIGWGVLLTLLTVAGVWLAAHTPGAMGTAPLILGVLGWLAFMGWLEKGVTK